METNTNHIITIETLIEESIDKVWDFWTTPAHVMNWNNATSDWHTPKAENDLRVGGQFTFTMASLDGSMAFDFTGTYTSVIHHKKIAYTLADERKVVVEFKPMDNGIVVTESFEAENVNSLELQKSGWQAILNNFKRYAEEIA